jgi:uncharacterized protein YggU (UPF0235/DUF167 family)
LRLRVSPGAGRAQVVGGHGDAWKVRVTAAPEHGRANEPSCACSLSVLLVPLNALALVSGHAARDKIVELTGLGPTLAERRLTSAATADRGRKDRRQ